MSLILSTAKQGVVGNATINDVTLVPGSNTFPMSATINETLVLGSLDPTLGVGMIDLLIVGNGSVYDGQHLTYYEKALQGTPLSLLMNVTQILLDSA